MPRLTVSVRTCNLPAHELVRTETGLRHYSRSENCFDDLQRILPHLLARWMPSNGEASDLEYVHPACCERVDSSPRAVLGSFTLLETPWVKTEARRPPNVMACVKAFSRYSLIFVAFINIFMSTFFCIRCIRVVKGGRYMCNICDGNWIIIPW